ncbi:50S ribosomal protein L17 [bacterium]|jgi:large subunit ribosomal protein L17|nr:50S ribosomal protein L17 [bacterium]MBT4251344.1 50S ribosomal protein L17 [bacterium]MBT4598275.1 50S ribosomal protein L17 [bacterium]MBT6754108.1 50S ribosomal protein L17 [bacterium]MBT7037928.1 50S ribosomal protein L17 [bacterium]
MNKRKKGRTLSRSKSQREALLRTLLVSLTKYKRIETSLAKAKELRPFAERMITKAKRASQGEGRRMAMIRELKKDLPTETVMELLRFAEKFAKREGGYLRIIKMMHRRSDASDRALVEWVEEFEEVEEKEAKKAPVTAKKEVKKVKKTSSSAKVEEKKVDKTEDKKDKKQSDE